MTYTDIFDKMRWTEFCWTFAWENENTINASLCPTHNGTDWSGTISSQTTTSITITVIGKPPQDLPGAVRAPLPPR
jgi:hypothetical protein